MRAIHYTKQFRKDVKLAQKRRKDITKLKNIMSHLVEEIPLAEKHKDHSLSGDFTGYRECHIESDWLVIYKFSSLAIHFVRTGTHSDLFS